MRGTRRENSINQSINQRRKKGLGRRKKTKRGEGGGGNKGSSGRKDVVVGGVIKITFLRILSANRRYCYCIDVGLTRRRLRWKWTFPTNFLTTTTSSITGPTSNFTSAPATWPIRILRWVFEQSYYSRFTAQPGRGMASIDDPIFADGQRGLGRDAWMRSGGSGGRKQPIRERHSELEIERSQSEIA